MATNTEPNGSNGKLFLALIPSVESTHSLFGSTTMACRRVRLEGSISRGGGGTTGSWSQQRK